MSQVSMLPSCGFLWIPNLQKDVQHIVTGYLTELDQIKLFFARGGKCKLTERCYEHAALRGNLVNMKWLKQNDCPWNAWTFHYAAWNGCLKNMKWLKENGCPWRPYSQWPQYALNHVTPKTAQWCRENLIWNLCFMMLLSKGICLNINKCIWKTIWCLFCLTDLSTFSTQLWCVSSLYRFVLFFFSV